MSDSPAPFKPKYLVFLKHANGPTQGETVILEHLFSAVLNLVMPFQNYQSWFSRNRIVKNNFFSFFTSICLQNAGNSHFRNRNFHNFPGEDTSRPPKHLLALSELDHMLCMFRVQGLRFRVLGLARTTFLNWLYSPLFETNIICYHLILHNNVFFQALKKLDSFSYLYHGSVVTSKSKYKI